MNAFEKAYPGVIQINELNGNSAGGNQAIWKKKKTYGWVDICWTIQVKYKICLCIEKNIAIFPNSDEHENVCQTFSINVQHSAAKEKASI